MKSIFFITFFLIISLTCFADEEIIHLVAEHPPVYEKLSKLEMQNTLVESAKKYEKYGQVARATHHDMAYPKNNEEYIKMGGFGVLWVTSHSQLKDELPIKNLRISVKNIGNIYLEPIYSFLTDEQDEFIAKILGKNRADAIYMIPFFEELQGATLVADYSANRVDFILGELNKEFPAEIGPLFKLPTKIVYPDKEIFNVMLKREYPIVKSVVLNSKIPNPRFKRDTLKPFSLEPR